MALTYGTAPFGPNPAGLFNFERRGPTEVLYWEDFPKRVRVEIGGEVVADSRSVKALHETGQMMRLFFARADVRTDLLEGAERSKGSDVTGDAHCWSVRAGGRLLKAVVRSYDDPPRSAPPIQGYLSFDLEKVDAWYLEDDEGYAHPRDPYHSFDIHNAARRVIVRLGDRVIADSKRPRILFETGVAPRYYLPLEDVRVDLFERSETVSECPYKGDGQHWNVSSDGKWIKDAAWSLPAPLGEATQIKDWFCFYAEKVELEIDGHRIRD